MPTKTSLSIQRYAPMVFGLFLILYVYRIHSFSILYYTANSPLKNVDTNYTYWLLLLLQFPSYIIQQKWLCTLIDSGVFVVCVFCIFSKKKRYIFARILLFLFFIQISTLQIFSCTHTKSIACLMIALLPFVCKEEKNTVLLIEFARYFLIYIMVISAYHKVVNGGLMQTDNFPNMLLHQHLDLATLYPQHISYCISHWLIEHKTIANGLFVLLFCTQAIFVIGIFTKRYDRILFVLLFGFAVSTYFIMRIYNFDIVLLGLTLIFFKGTRKRQSI